MTQHASTTFQPHATPDAASKPPGRSRLTRIKQRLREDADDAVYTFARGAETFGLGLEALVTDMRDVLTRTLRDTAYYLRRDSMDVPPRLRRGAERFARRFAIGSQQLGRDFDHAARLLEADRRAILVPQVSAPDRPGTVAPAPMHRVGDDPLFHRRSPSPRWAIGPSRSCMNLDLARVA